MIAPATEKSLHQPTPSADYKDDLLAQLRRCPVPVLECALYGHLWDDTGYLTEGESVAGPYRFHLVTHLRRHCSRCGTTESLQVRNHNFLVIRKEV